MAHGAGRVEEEVRFGFPFFDLIGAEECFPGWVVAVREAFDEPRAGEGHFHFSHGRVCRDAAVRCVVWCVLGEFIEEIEQLVDSFDCWHALGLEHLVADPPVVLEERGEWFADLLLDFRVDLVEVSAFEVRDGVCRVDVPACVADALSEESVRDGLGIDEYAVTVEDDEFRVAHGCTICMEARSCWSQSCRL